LFVVEVLYRHANTDFSESAIKPKKETRRRMLTGAGYKRSMQGYKRRMQRGLSKTLLVPGVKSYPYRRPCFKFVSSMFAVCSHLASNIEDTRSRTHDLMTTHTTLSTVEIARLLLTMVVMSIEVKR